HRQRSRECPGPRIDQLRSEDQLFELGNTVEHPQVNILRLQIMHFADRLAAAVRAKQTPLCVGLDPRLESLPKSVTNRHAGNVAAAYEEFCLRVLDIVAPLVGVVKPQSAFFEACGPAGMTVLLHVMQRARQLGLVAILDAKRGDIASTATAYA